MPAPPVPEALVMAKPAGPRCNLDCRYCYYLSKEALFAPDVPRRMPEDLLERFIAQRLELSPGPGTHFEWHGGEPTLVGLDYFRKIVALQRTHRPAGRTISNGIQTNGTTLDEAWARFLADEGFSVGLSLDGPAELHDRFRRTRNDRPTHAAVMRAWRLLRQHEIHTDVLCVVHAGNAARPMAAYRFFREEGVRFLQFLPLVEPVGAGPEVSARTARPKDVGSFLCAIFDEWARSDLGRITVQLFDEAFRAACGLPHVLCVFRETCGDVTVLEHDGGLYACDHFVEPAHRLGTLRERSLGELLADPARERFGRSKAQALPRCCRECDVLAYCHGGCPKDRVATSADGEPGLSYLCPAFRQFFRHARPVVERLAAQWRERRPLGAIAAQLRGNRAPAAPAPGRNDSCPCGSGRKYKKCCLARAPIR